MSDLRITLLASLLLAAALPTGGYAQIQPQVEGRVDVDLSNGLLRGDLCLSRLPVQDEYSFLLNRGFNVREVQNTATGENVRFGGGMGATNVGEATPHRLAGDDLGPEGFCVRYVGAFPIYRVDEGERSVSDWKGQIAFDGNTVRATEQTVFYPTLQDTTSGAAVTSVTYRIEVSCPECRSLYMNGAAPAAGPAATFTSTVPRSLFLFAGDFPFTNGPEGSFVGADVSETDSRLIREATGRISGVLDGLVDAPYPTDPVTFLSFASVSADRRIGRNTWAFVTWPTVALDGREPFSSLLESEGSSRALSRRMYRFLSHEMAHAYFGSSYFPSGPLFWFLLESTAEFLALKASGVMEGDSVFNERARDDYAELEDVGEVVPLDEITEVSQIDRTYRYVLGPLLLTVLEEEIGTEPLRRALGSFVTDPPAGAIDYAAFRRRLSNAGAPEAALDRFEAECLVATVSESCLADRFGQ